MKAMEIYPFLNLSYKDCQDQIIKIIISYVEPETSLINRFKHSPTLKTNNKNKCFF